MDVYPVRSPVQRNVLSNAYQVAPGIAMGRAATTVCIPAMNIAPAA